MVERHAISAGNLGSTPGLPTAHMKQRLWVCPECGVVRAVIDGDPAFPPTCSLHTEHWPDGEFSRTVYMQKTTTFVEVEDATISEH